MTKKKKKAQPMTLRRKAVLYLLSVTHPTPVKGVAVKKHPLQDKVDAVFARDGFGCQTNLVAELVTALTGVVPKLPTASGSLPMHTVVVPVANTNEHNYNGACMVVLPETATVKALRADGVRGNNLAVRDTQKASRDQIEWFVNMLPEAAFRQHLGFLAHV